MLKYYLEYCYFLYFMKLYNIFFIFFSFLLEIIPNNLQKNKKERNIVIFVHGTHAICGFFNGLFRLNNIHKWFFNIKKARTGSCSECKNSIKVRWNINLEKQKTIIGKTPGLISIDDENNNSISKAGSLILQYFKHFFEMGSSNLTSYYVYNWNGALCSTHRTNAANNLGYALKVLINECKEQNEIPKIYLIGYSHGGNVCLNLANIIDKINLKCVVDYLILIGTPIYENSELNLIKKINNNDFLFKNVINIFSVGDKLQTLDISNYDSKKWFTRRKFETTRENLFQISFFYNTENKFKKNMFDFKYFNKKCNFLKKYINNFYRSIFKNKEACFNFYAPSHRGLAFYALSKKYCNIYPPVKIFIPLVIKFLKDPFINSFDKNNMVLLFISKTNEIYLFDGTNNKKIGYFKNKRLLKNYRAQSLKIMEYLNSK
jgi:hypothetical protein